jgi:hypothetical protein
MERLAERSWEFFYGAGAGECLLGWFAETY